MIGSMRKNRVLRGGSWVNGARGTRAAVRFRYAPALRGLAVGFRVVCFFRAPGSATVLNLVNS